MSKRSLRLATIAGLALSVGSMAPAMALRIGGVAGAGVDIDPEMAINDVLNITESLPIAIPALPTLPSTASVLLLAGGLLGTPNTLLSTTLGGLTGVVAAANLGGILPECSLVAVASCNSAAGSGNVALPVNASNLNILGSGINTGDLGLGVVAPIIAPVTTTVGGILNGGVLGGGLPVPGVGGLLAGIGGLLNVSAGGSAGLNLGVIGGLLSL